MTDQKPTMPRGWNWLSRMLETQHPAWLVFSLSMAATILVLFIVVSSDYQVARGRFQARVERCRNLIERKLEDNERLLLGCVGLFNSSETVTREDWRRYVTTLRIDQYWRGILGVGFARHVTGNKLADHISQIRDEGFSDYKVWPEGDRENYFPIVYLEPFHERNQRAFGYDMFSEPVRHAAMKRAQDTGETAVSGMITLVQEIPGQPIQRGFLMYLPIYEGGVTPGTVQERKDRIFGFAYSPFRAEDLMDATLESEIPYLRIKIYDGSNNLANRLLYDSARYDTAQKTASKESAMFHQSRAIGLFGHTWTVTFESLPAFESGLESENPFFLMAGGLILSLLLFGLVAVQGSRLRTREELRKNQQLLQLQIEKMPMGHIMWDMDFQVVSWNPAAEKIFGFTASEAKGKRPEEFLLPKSSQEKVRAVMQLLINGAPTAQSVNENHTRDGKTIICDWNNTTLKEPDGKIIGILSMVRDITEQRRAEENLRESELRFRSTFEQAAVGVLHVSPNGNFLRVNQKACDITGYAREELLKKTFQEITHPEDLDADLENARKVLADQIENYSMEKRYIGPEGEIVWINLTVSLVRKPSGKPDYFIGVIEDIGDRKKMEYSLQKSYEQLESKSGELEELNLLFLKYNEQVAAINRTLQELARATALEKIYDVIVLTMKRELGISPVVLLEIRADEEPRIVREEGVSGEKLEKITSLLEHDPALKELAGGGPRLTQKSFMAESPWDWVFKNWMMLPLQSQRGVVGCLVFDDPGTDKMEGAALLSNQSGVFIENILLFQELAQSNIKLKDLDRQKSEFLNMVAHDLRTPLTSIRGYAELLLMYKDEPLDTQEEFLSIIKRESTRLGTLINDFLDLSRIESGTIKYEKAFFSVEGLVEHFVSVYKGETQRRNISLETKITPGLPRVYGDKDRIGQVLSNLLSNAVKFTPSNGSILVSAYLADAGRGGKKRSLENTGPDGSTSSNKRNASERDPELIISVTDNGPGIDPKYHKPIFDKFSQVDDRQIKSKGGTGLGLAICREILDHHGGKIWVESEPGKGASFKFTLKTTTDGASVKILVVDDDNRFRFSLMRYLAKDSAYILDQAANGTEAMIKIGTFQPDLLVLDMLMPEMDGVEVCRAIKKESQLSDLKIIITTAYQKSPKLDQIKAMGYTRILLKPFGKGEFLSLVADTIRRDVPAADAKQ